MIESILYQPFLASYIVVAGFLIASGVFFDRVAGEPLKKKIADYLQNNISFSMNLTEYTKYFVAGSITRYFNGDIMTARNFGKSLVVSLTSLSVVVALYSIKNNQNPLQFLNFIDHENEYMHALGLCLIFAAVILGDVLSILQTALLLNLVGAIRSANDVLFLLVCDLIITINIFVFVLPVGLQWATVANDFVGSDLVFAMQIPNTDSKANPEQINDEALKSLMVDASFKNVSVSSIASNSDQSARQHTIPVKTPVLYKNVDPAQAIREMMRELGKNVRDIPKLESLPEDDNLTSIFLNKPHITAEINLSSYLTYRGRANTYGLMFVQSRIAQNVFPMVVSLQPVTLQLGDVYATESGWTRTPHATAKNYYIKCGKAFSFADSIPDMKTCPDAAVIGIGETLRQTYVWSYRIRPFVKDIPIAPLAFSCLFLTFAFYALMLLSFAMIKMASLMHFVTFTYRYIDIEKSTFASMAAFACIFLVPIFAAAFAFYEVVLN